MNSQIAEKPEQDSKFSLDVQEVFPTIQGEGPFAGRPAVFVRLAGCNLQCPLCDTDYTSKRQRRTIVDLADVIGLYRKSGLVVLTGGEPFRQTIGPFIKLLTRRDYVVQVETNGTLFDETMFHNDLEWRGIDPWIICSPKTGSVNDRLKPWINGYKYILQHGKVDQLDGLPTSSLDFGVSPARPHEGFTGEVFVQPCDEENALRNRLNTQAAVESCQKYGYRLCLQLHKIVGLP